MRLLMLFASVLPMVVHASPATAAPIDITKHYAEMQRSLSYLFLTLRADADGLARDGLNDIGSRPSFTLDSDFVNRYLIGGGSEELHLPLASAEWSHDGTTFTYHYAAGGLWTIEDLFITRPDGSTHIGSWHATLSAFDIVTRKGGRGGSTKLGFYGGEFDPVTAEMLGLPGNDVYGEIQWYHDWHDDEVGAPERFGHADGYALMAVAEPNLLVLVGVALAAAGWHRARHIRTTERDSAS